MDDSLSQQINVLSQQLAERLLQLNGTLAVAESCTGGWLAKVLTDLPGSSQWFNGGVVSYTNKAKRQVLKVDEMCLQQFGAVSEEVAKQMAVGALTVFDASVSVSITGVAGPAGGTEAKPVGMVCFAIASRSNGVESCTKRFKGGRLEVRQQAVLMALQKLTNMLLN
ncbi:MAG: damage-inducible protein CinA [Piscirickettsiaceae bacterium]|nr:MAG: damage-inducible protein CinA [Piscirickettsiaceae bacterium]